MKERIIIDGVPYVRELSNADGERLEIVCVSPRYYKDGYSTLVLEISADNPEELGRKIPFQRFKPGDKIIIKKCAT